MSVRPSKMKFQGSPPRLPRIIRRSETCPFPADHRDARFSIPVSCMSPVFCLLSPVCCLLSSVSCLLSSVSCLLSSVRWLRSRGQAGMPTLSGQGCGYHSGVPNQRSISSSKGATSSGGSSTSPRSPVSTIQVSRAARSRVRADWCCGFAESTRLVTS